MTSFAIASVIVSFAALPVIMSNSETPHQVQAVRFNLRRLFQISQTGMLGCLACGLANGAFWALAPVFTAGVSDSISLAAGFMTGTVIGGALGQWPLGIWSDRADRRIVIAAATLLAAVTGIAIWLFASHMSSAVLILFSGIWGALAFPVYALSVAHANDFAEDGEYVMVSAGLLFMYGIGAAVGPAIAAGVMTLFSQNYLYLYTAAIHVFLFAYVMVRLRRRASAPMEQHVPFSEALTAVQTASQVYEEER
jgi:MFS family permease